MRLLSSIPHRTRSFLALLVLTLFAATGHAQIFVSNFTAGTIGEYQFDGTPINTALISGLSGPWSVAASDSNLFVATQPTGSIAKYNFDGSVVNPTLVTGLDNPTGLAVYGPDLFVSFAGTGNIGLYTLDGAPLKTILIPGLGSLSGVAVVTAIPEPATYSAVVGLAVLGWSALRRRRLVG